MDIEKAQKPENKPEQLNHFCFLLVKPIGMTVLQQIIEMVKISVDIVAAKSVTASEPKIRSHYELTKFDKSGKRTAYYPTLIEYMRNHELYAMVIQDRECRSPEEFVTFVKEHLVGFFQPFAAERGSIRYLAIQKHLPFLQLVTSTEVAKNEGIPDPQPFIYDNLIHSSGNPSEALREIEIWFPGEQIAVTAKNKFNHYYSRNGES